MVITIMPEEEEDSSDSNISILIQTGNSNTDNTFCEHNYVYFFIFLFFYFIKKIILWTFECGRTTPTCTLHLQCPASQRTTVRPERGEHRQQVSDDGRRSLHHRGPLLHPEQLHLSLACPHAHDSQFQ